MQALVDHTNGTRIGFPQLSSLNTRTLKYKDNLVVANKDHIYCFLPLDNQLDQGNNADAAL
jgi:hypothetical protein